MSSDPKLHVFEEVAKHNKTKDCWLVYDVIPFMDDHPGGDEVLLSATDATNDFEDIGHSDEACEMMDKYYIGEIDPATVPSKHTFSQPPQQSAAHSANKSPILSSGSCSSSCLS
ncbi:hypothetical protein SASPL_125438 [Salvia splendens]|uniref:Cytochrome b5 heme-binding domain-containing protein n=1 Tax=Salvia splendens TaxID=180675 RepID=A0A8X8ZPV0_SALSN|nr:hypothetical protein SASPL_125438 [Salvia splendens]